MSLPATPQRGVPTTSITISEEMLSAVVSARVEEVLTSHAVRTMTRRIIRQQIGSFTLHEACRWLKWKNPESLRRALARAGVEKIKTSSTKLTFSIEALRAFRDSRTVKRKTKRTKVVPFETGAKAA